MKKPKLDLKTIEVLKRVLAMPPKPHDEMKVGQSKKRKPKAPASSSKPPAS
ncbi:MAG: hypothetical protein Q8L54_03170 [Devosia sp.]|nr:hypothetical protein [Devosia sp.]